MQERIVLIGGGGHCKSVIDVIEREGKYKIFGIIDKKELIGTKVLDYPIIDSDENLEDVFKQCSNAIITVGQIHSNEIRVKLFNLVKKIGFTMPSIISHLAYVSKYATIGEGSIIMHGSIVNVGVNIGKNCIINTNALLEHDVVVENHCHISTASVLNGEVVVKENSFFGSNSVAKQGIVIDGFIKAGSLVK